MASILYCSITCRPVVTCNTTSTAFTTFRALSSLWWTDLVFSCLVSAFLSPTCSSSSLWRKDFRLLYLRWDNPCIFRDANRIYAFLINRSPWISGVHVVSECVCLYPNTKSCFYGVSAGDFHQIKFPTWTCASDQVDHTFKSVTLNQKHYKKKLTLWLNFMTKSLRHKYCDYLHTG